MTSVPTGLQPTDAHGITGRHYLGTANEHLAAAHYLARGWQVYWPAAVSDNADLIVSRHGELLRVQVKTVTAVADKRTGAVSLQCIVRRDLREPAARDRYDVLFAISEDRAWEIPSADIGNLCTLRFGQPKRRWDRHEVPLVRS